MRRRAALPGRTLNDTLSAQLRREVVKLDALPIAAGQVVHVAFEGTSSPWRQGVRVATEGALTANDVTAPQLDLWTDTAPPADLLPDGSRLYRCNDIGFDPDFSKLVFRISIT